MAEQLFELTETEAVLWEIAKAVRDTYRGKLIAHGHTATRKLADTVTQEVVTDAGTYEVVLHLEDYWKYVETGTRGRKTGLPGRKDPPFDAIYKWVTIKHILPRPDSSVPTQEALAHIIAHRIGEYGTKGTHDLEETKDEVLPGYMDRLREALGRDAIIYINRYIVEVFNK